MHDPQERSRKQTPRPFFGPRPPHDRPPAAPADATRVTPTRDRPRLFTPPGAGAAVGGLVAASAASGVPRTAGTGASAANAAMHSAAATDTGLGDLKEIEPWALPAGEASDPNPALHVADALERVARRIRSGDIILPPDSSAATDDAALALALAAVLRAPVR